MSWTYTLRVNFHRDEIADDGVERWIADGGWTMSYGRMQGPMPEDMSMERALKARRVCPTTLTVPLHGLVRMLLLGPDQGY